MGTFHKTNLSQESSPGYCFRLKSLSYFITFLRRRFCVSPPRLLFQMYTRFHRTRAGNRTHAICAKSSRGKNQMERNFTAYTDIRFSNKRALLHAICCQNMVLRVWPVLDVYCGDLKYRIRQHVDMNTTSSDHVLPLG